MTFRDVLGVVKGRTVQHRNGTTGPLFFQLALACGHDVTRAPSRGVPKRARCEQCERLQAAKGADDGD